MAAGASAVAAIDYAGAAEEAQPSKHWRIATAALHAALNSGFMAMLQTLADYQLLDARCKAFAAEQQARNAVKAFWKRLAAMERDWLLPEFGSAELVDDGTDPTPITLAGHEMQGVLDAIKGIRQRLVMWRAELAQPTQPTPPDSAGNVKRKAASTFEGAELGT